jgi:ribonuclease HI
MMIEAKKSREDHLEGKTSWSNIGERHKEWKQLWKMNLPSKIKKLCWRLALNSIPTASMLKHRNMIESDMCQLCGAEKDTWDHALLYCTMSRCVWAQLDEEIIEIIASLCASDPKQWALFMCSNMAQVEGRRVLVTCWAIWQARRKAIYDGIFHSPLSTFNMVNRLLDELETLEKYQMKGMCQQLKKVNIRHCMAPESGQFKVNNDAAVARTSCIGTVGAICRDNHGNFIAASALTIPNITELETLEAMACVEALALAENCGIKNLTVTSNCLNVIKNIKETTRCPYMMMLQDLKVRSKCFDYVPFAHEGRESNREAHCLAKHACTLRPGHHVCLGSPPVYLNVNIFC